jgi:hypothetical protein
MLVETDLWSFSRAMSVMQKVVDYRAESKTKNRRWEMRKSGILMIIMAIFMLTGCSSKTGSAGLGALGGAAAGAGGYEYHLKRQQDRIEQDYKDGKITQSEYEIRKNQIERDSFLK